MSIETIILKAMESKFNTKGDSFRIKHEFKMNGAVCTESHKDPALVVTRDKNGWVWHCHRCAERGYIGDKYVSPDATYHKLRNLKEEELPKKSYVVKLPDDFVPLTDYNYLLDPDVPFEAHSWLWKYNITEKNMFDFELGWSNKYKMVIVPLYNYLSRLEGWIGRRVFDSKNKKYHIQKATGSKRMYFTTGKNTAPTVVLVEDFLSAIRVYKATGVATTALLTTSIDEDLTRQLHGKEVYIWLDADALAKSVAMVARFRQLGIEAKHIYTTKDPKCYNDIAIKDLWRKAKEV